MENKIPIYTDNRGEFIPYDLEGWSQMNISTNKFKYTFRGLHWQTNPSQTKLVKIIQGIVIDILYDLNSTNVEFYELTKDNDLFVPNNYAHGFLTLEPNTIFTYLVKGEYNPQNEYSIVWDSIPEVKSIIESYTTADKLTISEKDKIGK